MSEGTLILLIGEQASNLEAVRTALAGGEEQLSVQYIERLRTALARIAGGGVGAVLLDISSRNSASQLHDAVVALRTGTPDTPIIILGEAGDEKMAAQVLTEGALCYIPRSNWQRDLKQRVLSEIRRRKVSSHPSDRTETRSGAVIAFLGSKGGVGTTTVAMNVASALASTSKVIVAELRSPFGTLCHFFRPHRTVRGLQNLLDCAPGEIDVSDVESSLWPNRDIPGLSVLFDPDDSGAFQKLGPDQAREIVGRLSELSDTVVIDLPPSLSDETQAIVERADTLVLVVERDCLSVEAAKAKLRALEKYAIIPREAGVVVVNRVALSAPMALTDIEAQLGVPLFAVIPPAADLCASAYRAHAPVVRFDAQSLMGTSLIQLAKRLSGQL